MAQIVRLIVGRFSSRNRDLTLLGYTEREDQYATL